MTKRENAQSGLTKKPLASGKVFTQEIQGSHKKKQKEKTVSTLMEGKNTAFGV